MRRTRQRAGMSLIELLIAAMCMVVVGLALIGFMKVTYGAQDTISGQNTADSSARQALDIMSDSIRDAQKYNTGVATTSAVVSATSPTSITVYNCDGNQNVDGTLYTRYFLNGTNLQKSVNGGAATTLLTGVQSLLLEYYSSSDYTTPYTPTSSDYYLLGAVRITASVSTTQINTYSRTYQSFVKFRNSQPAT